MNSDETSRIPVYGIASAILAGIPVVGFQGGAGHFIGLSLVNFFIILIFGEYVAGEAKEKGKREGEREAEKRFKE